MQNSLSLFNPFDSLFDSMFYKPSVNRVSSYNKANILKTDSGYELQMDIPGVHKEDVNIEVEGKKILVTVSRQETQEDNQTYLLRERTLEKFSRWFSFPEPIDENSVEASLNNGVLNLKIKSTSVSKKRILIN